MSDQKRLPFDRLKSILNDGDVSDKAYDNINKLFNEENNTKTDNIWFKIKSFFSAIDGKIFTNPSRKWNSNYHKR